LIHIRNTKAKYSPDSALKRNNMLQACHRRRGPFAGLAALVGDVMITGATARAATAALRAAGVIRLELWVAARVVQPS
jgi:predicted amidophosphoribosyltransferase